MLTFLRYYQAKTQSFPKLQFFWNFATNKSMEPVLPQLKQAEFILSPGSIGFKRIEITHTRF